MIQNSTNKIRPQTAHLTCRLLVPLLDSGVVSSDEYAIIKRNLDALAKTGELAPAIPQKFIPPQEVAEMLCISYSQFRQLEKDGVFEPYFKRRCIGSKTVRYLNTEILNYMLIGSITKGD